MARARTPAAEMATVWFHPQRGVLVSIDPLPPETFRYRGGADTDWRDVARIEVATDPHYGFIPHAGQALPKGFLWGDPAKQLHGLGPPHWIYGPLERTCFECGDPFVFTAQAQRHLYERLRAFSDVTALRCRGCARKRHAIDRARAEYAEALRGVRAESTATTHLAVARAVVELVKAGGRASLDKAIGHARRAHKLGAGVGALKAEKQLIKLRR